MGNFTERSRLFNAFIILVFLAHCVQLVFNQPLITRQSQSLAAPVPFSPERTEEPFPASTSGSSGSSSSANTNANANANAKPVSKTQEEPVPGETVQSTSDSQTTNSLCSLFRTFLDSPVQCRVSRLNANSEDVESNALIQIRSPPSNNLRTGPPASADSRIDNFDEDDDSQADDQTKAEDNSKVIQDKTTIIIPDRPCPAGQRRDPRGYCRTVLRIRTYNGQQISVRPVRYYYRRFVAIPTLHFVLP